MKKYIYIFVFFVFASLHVFSQVCCPEFTLVTDSINPCDSNSCRQKDPITNPNNGISTGADRSFLACKNQPYNYLVVPNLTNFNYNWSVLGGTIETDTLNPAIINWGNVPYGYLQVIITSDDGTCIDTITRTICLLYGPTAGITYSPDTICENSFVNFSGETSFGASNYYWDFGDGTFSDLENPLPHHYYSSGNYTVVLTVSNVITIISDKIIITKDCGCKDTAMVVVHVSNEEGIDIHTDDCRKMLCEGDTVKYCTDTPGCTNLNWVVNGGTIISGQGTTCITAVWNLPVTDPTSVTLNADCPSTCGNSATLIVPVLFPHLPIQGPDTVCQGSSSTYSLPALSGTFYHWSISGGGGGTIAGYNINDNVINVNWGNSPGGPYTISCNYENQYSECSGTSTLQVMVKPKFTISVPSPTCTGSTSAISVIAGGLANWKVSPTTGFTPPGIPPGEFNGVSNISLTWNTAGNYTITAFPITASNYCNDSAITNVVIYPTPVLNPIAGETIICPDQLFNYLASSSIPGGSFSWSLVGGGTISSYGEGNSNASVIFTGTGPTWTITATQTVNWCSGSKSITVNKVPVPPAITLSSASICSGGTITASVPGAIPPGGYTWSSTPGAVLTTGQGTTSAAFIVNDNAQITISSCGGSKTINVTITTSSVTVSQSISTCSATLTAAPGGGSYSWFLDGDNVGNTNPITVTQNGTYVVQANYGSCMAHNQIVVTGITPVIASISSTGDLCNGGVVTLYALVNAVCPGASFIWSNGATVSPITVNTPGSYSATVTCTNGCNDVSNVIHVPPCLIGPGAPCINDLTISGNNNCSNPINLSASAPGCTPTSTTWYYGDGTIGSTGTHYYTSAGAYSVYANMGCTDGTYHCDSINITIPMVDSITSVITCGTNAWTIHLQDASLYLPAYSGYLRTWSTTCGTLDAISTSNPELTVHFGCNPIVTLTISKNGCTLTNSVTFDFPETTFDIIGPNPVCIGSNYEYNSSFTTNIISYNWNFGDLTTGVTNPITHSYNGTPPNPTITLNITDSYGCIFDTTKLITVNTPTPLTISPSPLVEICPDCLPPFTLMTNPATGFTGYQWFKDGTALSDTIGSTYQLCNFNASGNYFVTANDSFVNCPETSDTVQVVYFPKPVADIHGQTIQCISGTGNIHLYNSTTDSNYTYLWEVNPVVPITPGNTLSYANITASASTDPYQFILTVTDTTSGCIAKDTFCVYVYTKPTVNILPAGYLCEGINHTFIANATPLSPDYIYHWNNGATGINMTTAQSGNYFVTVTDPESGCSASSNRVFINNRPYVDLFPVGCDTLCDTIKLIPPLPLWGHWQTNHSVYTTNWYENTTLISNNSMLDLSGLALGQHNIYIEVTFNGDTCISTSGIYDLFIKPCDSCTCDNSHFTNLTWNLINHPLKKDSIDCGGRVEYEVNCNNPISIHAGFECDSCSSSITYSLFNNGTITQTGNMDEPFTTTGLLAGFYTLQMIGQCAGINCDTCTVTFQIDCEPSPCCPQLEQIIIRNSNENLAQQTYQGNDYSLYTTQVSIAGGVTPYTEVRATVIDYQLTANYNDCIDCKNLPFTWASIGAGSLTGIQPETTGASPAVGYFIPSNIFGNPREVVWNNGAPINLSAPQNTSLSFFLPPMSKIPCCMLKAKVCVKFSLIDINCNLCEKIVCYEVSIGDTTVNESCCCEQWSSSQVTIIRKSTPETRIRPLNIDCGGSTNLTLGEYTISVPAFNCSPTTCNVSYSWTVDKKSVLNGHVASETGRSFTFNFSSPGQYLVTFTPQCGSCKCVPCKIIIYIEGEGTDCVCGEWLTHTLSIHWKKPELQNATIKCPQDKPFDISSICSGQSVSGTFCKYVCAPRDCQVKYNWEVIGPGNVRVAGENYSSTVEYCFTPLTTGIYTLYITPVCGTTRCEDKCVIEIDVRRIIKCGIPSTNPSCP